MRQMVSGEDAGFKKENLDKSSHEIWFPRNPGLGSNTGARALPTVG